MDAASAPAAAPDDAPAAELWVRPPTPLDGGAGTPSAAATPSRDTLDVAMSPQALSRALTLELALEKANGEKDEWKAQAKGLEIALGSAKQAQSAAESGVKEVLVEVKPVVPTADAATWTGEDIEGRSPQKLAQPLPPVLKVEHAKANDASSLGSSRAPSWRYMAKRGGCGVTRGRAAYVEIGRAARAARLREEEDRALRLRNVDCPPFLKGQNLFVAPPPGAPGALHSPHSHSASSTSFPRVAPDPRAVVRNVSTAPMNVVRAHMLAAQTR